MITNKEDFTKHRKTRLELLEERIIAAEKIIEELNKELKEEGISEIAQVEKVLRELKEMKQTMIENESRDNQNLEIVLNEVNRESLLLINNDKMRIKLENEKLQNEKIEREAYIKKLQEELVKKNLDIEISKKREEDLHTINSILEEKVRNLKSKAYGYDIAKKFEMHQNKLNAENKKSIDPNRNKPIEDENMAYNFWERENNYSLKNPPKLDDLAKQKQLWIANSNSNIEKLIYDIDSSHRKKENSNLDNYLYNRYANSLNTNMRKYSPMILNNNK